MSVVLILILASLLIAGGFLAAFIWSVKSGQYDDDCTPGIRMLFDSDGPDPSNEFTQNADKLGQDRPFDRT